jgi:NTP-dependent ternary system trypsin peptidase co-occuring protein
MAERVKFVGEDGSFMWVEVTHRDDADVGLVADEDGEAKALTKLEDSLASLRGAAVALLASISGMGKPPDEVTLELALSFGIEGGVIVAKGSDVLAPGFVRGRNTLASEVTQARHSGVCGWRSRALSRAPACARRVPRCPDARLRARRATSCVVVIVEEERRATLLRARRLSPRLLARDFVFSGVRT